MTSSGTHLRLVTSQGSVDLSQSFLGPSDGRTCSGGPGPAAALRSSSEGPFTSSLRTQCAPFLSFHAAALLSSSRALSVPRLLSGIVANVVAYDNANLSPYGSAG